MLEAELVAAGERPLSVDEVLLWLNQVLRSGEDPVEKIRDVPMHSSGIEFAEPSQLRCTLKPPLDVERLVALLGLEGDFVVVSGDVHQRSWRLMVRAGRLSERRIAVEFPKLGAWLLDMTVSGRPPGPLPGIVAGASPAYPAGRNVSVTSLRFFAMNP